MNQNPSFTCPLADECLTVAQSAALAEMRLMEKIGKGGGLIKLYWDGKRWKITAIRGSKAGDSPERERT